MIKRNKIAFLFLITPLILGSCSLFYSNHIDDGNYHFVSGGIRGDAYCYEVSFDGVYDIVIPDYIQEYKVAKLGGYLGRGYPMPFFVNIIEYEIKNRNLTEDEYKYSSEMSNEEFELCKQNVICYDFRLHLGENIKEIFTRKYEIEIKMREEYITFRTRYYVEVSEKNKNFYSKNGKIYTKKGELIDDFDYFE